MARKVWSGHLTFGLVTIPIGLATGARDESTSLGQFHTCGSRTKRPDYCPECRRIIERSEITKGWEVSKDKHITIAQEEIDVITPTTEKVIEISEFVEWADVDPIYLAESFYVLPEDAGKKPYSLIVKALRDTGKVGIAQMTKNNREHVVLLRPKGNGLMMHCLYYPNEIHELSEFDSMAEYPLSAADVKLAGKLVESLAGPFQPTKYENGYDMRLNQLIASKINSKVLAPTPVKAVVPASIDLTAALQASLDKPKRKITVPQTMPVATAVDKKKGKKKVA